MFTPTPNDILSLAQSVPEVNNCLEYWRQGFLTWEQALMLAIIYLAHHNSELTSSAIKVINTVIEEGGIGA